MSQRQRKVAAEKMCCEVNMEISAIAPINLSASPIADVIRPSCPGWKK